MKLYIIVSLVAAMLLPVAVSASYGTEASEAAQWAVRQEIRSRLGSQYRVSFEEASEKILSLSEEVVSGKAHVRDSDDWDLDRTFNYSIKVKYDGSSTRDLSIDFTDGEKVKGKSDWQQSRHDSEFVHLSKPAWYEKFDTGEVEFEGESRVPVTITVFDKKGKQVADGTTTPRSGKFRLSMRLPDGLFRAVVMPRGGSDADEVRFSVSDDSHDWGHPSTTFRVEEPGREASVRGPRVTISGASSERSAHVQIWDSANNRVIDRDVPTRDGYFNTSVEVRDGSFRVLIESGRSSESRRFKVWSNNNRPDSGRPTLTVLEPANNATFAGTRVTVAGNTRAHSVRVQIWDERDQRVIDRNVPTRDNCFNTSVELQEGKYRLKIEDAGTASESREFRVKGSGKPSGGFMRSLKVAEPQRDGFTRGPNVTISGECSQRSVRVQIWDSADKRVLDRNVPTRGTYWNTMVPLSSGTYRVRVESESGRDSEEFTFQVKIK